jgi:hypothetical protein
MANLFEGIDADYMKNLLDESDDNSWAAIQKYFVKEYSRIEKYLDKGITSYRIPIELDGREEVAVYVSRIHKQVISFTVLLVTKDDVEKLESDFFLALLEMNLLLGGFAIDDVGLCIKYNALVLNLSPMEAGNILSRIASSAKVILKKLYT